MNPDASTTTGDDESAASSWIATRGALDQVGASSAARALWQLSNTLLPYGLLWYLMVRSIQLEYATGWTLLLALIAAAFLVRIFILFHDCVHGSLFPSRRANRIVGRLLGLLVLTPFHDWRCSHLRHHATHANLDARGHGDIWTMTLSEYRQASAPRRMQYRLYRHPLVLVVLGGLFHFLIQNRFPTPGTGARERRSVWLTNAAIVSVILLLSEMIGWRTYWRVQLPVIWLAGMSGVWLFYVQHQFSDSYWARKAHWNPRSAALRGSSYFKLPAVLNWFSASIGFHHIHHLNPRIPNYRLAPCHRAVPAVQVAKPLTIRDSVRCFHLKCWDERCGRMVPFSPQPPSSSVDDSPPTF